MTSWLESGGERCGPAPRKSCGELEFTHHCSAGCKVPLELCSSPLRSTMVITERLCAISLLHSACHRLARNERLLEGAHSFVSASWSAAALTHPASFCAGGKRIYP
jgi:hypothetical protein